MSNILIIDDDTSICLALKSAVHVIGHNADYALTIEDGIIKLSSESYDVVFLDVNMPDGDGLNILPKIKSFPAMPEVIIMTGEGSPDGAEIAIKNGAWDYLEKPLSIDVMTLPLLRALQYRKEKAMAKTSVNLKREGIIGESPQIRSCLDLIAQASLSDVNVLINGETGTGKELFASAIHENSSRSARNFVIVDCAALPETLVESTLFGHVKGAFTGADRDKEGLIKQADRGTLFLDEIGELPMSIQKAFLRVLQERSFRPIGDKKEIKSDFRLIVATNRDLNQMIKEGKFRHDLFYRIKSLTLDLPPLRERPRDIKDLVMHIVIKACEREGISAKGFSPEFINTLEAYGWPGNVRELINVLEVSINRARYEPTLFPKHLPDLIRINVARSIITAPDGEKGINKRNYVRSDSLPTIKKFRETIIAENESKYLEKLIAFTEGNVQEACRISGLGRSRLYGLMKNYGIIKSF